MAQLSLNCATLNLLITGCRWRDGPR